MAINKPVLMIPWRNLYGASVELCSVVSLLSGSPVDTETVTLSGLTVGRDYWLSDDGVADSAAGNGDLLAIVASAIVAQVSRVSTCAPSFTAAGLIRLTCTFGAGADAIEITFSTDSGMTAEGWARMFGVDEGAPEITTSAGVASFPNLSDRLYYPARPFHRDSGDRREYSGSSVDASDGSAWPVSFDDYYRTREVGWDFLTLKHALDEHAEATAPYNTAENIRENGLRHGRRVRLFPDISDLGSSDFVVYEPKDPLGEIAKQGSAEDQIFHDVRISLVRPSGGA